MAAINLPEMQWWVWSQDIPWLSDTIPEMICALLTRNQARIATLNFDTMFNRATQNGLSNSSSMYFIFSLLTSFIFLDIYISRFQPQMLSTVDNLRQYPTARV